jgi:hypothetical protein
MAIRNEAPEGAEVFDIEAARQARAEVRAAEGKGNPFLKLSAGYVEVKSEFPITVAFKFQAEDIRGGLEDFLADPADIDVLLENGLSAQDLQEITKFVAGLTLGE